MTPNKKVGPAHQANITSYIKKKNDDGEADDEAELPTHISQTKAPGNYFQRA